MCKVKRWISNNIEYLTEEYGGYHIAITPDYKVIAKAKEFEMLLGLISIIDKTEIYIDYIISEYDVKTRITEVHYE
jgi:hypothetical protein